MRQPQGHQHAFRANRAPAIRQVPEQHLQPDVDPGLVNDRHVDREAAAAVKRPAHQRAGQFRIAEPDAAVVPSNIAIREASSTLHRRWGSARRPLLTLPRAQQVALAHQLRPGPPAESDAPHHEPPQDEQPDATGSDQTGAGRFGAPAAASDAADGARDALVDGPVAQREGDGLGELRVLAEHV